MDSEIIHWDTVWSDTNTIWSECDSLPSEDGSSSSSNYNTKEMKQKKENKWTKALECYAVQVLSNHCENVTAVRWAGRLQQYRLRQLWWGYWHQRAGLPFWRQKYRNGDRIWYLQCERRNIRNETSSGVNRCLLYLTAFFKWLFSIQNWVTGWTIRGLHLPQEWAIFLIFLKRSDWIRRLPTYLVCSAGFCFESKTAVAWSWPPTSSQFWVIEWVELCLNCSTRLHDLHSHNVCFSPQTTTVPAVERFDEVFPDRLMHTVTCGQHFVTFLL